MPRYSRVVSIKGDNKFKKITVEQFKECGWFYSNGDQPISNGEIGVVIEDKEIMYLITCCSNCGSYTIMDEDDWSEGQDEMSRLMKTLYYRVLQDR